MKSLTFIPLLIICFNAFCQIDSLIIRVIGKGSTITQYEQFVNWEIKLYNIAFDKFKVPKYINIGSIYQNDVDFGVEVQELECGRLSKIDSCLTLIGPSSYENETIVLNRGSLYSWKFNLPFCINKNGEYRLRLYFITRKKKLNQNIYMSDWYNILVNIKE